jgi:hypothetical protein
VSLVKESTQSNPNNGLRVRQNVAQWADAGSLGAKPAKDAMTARLHSPRALVRERVSGLLVAPASSKAADAGVQRSTP